MECFIVKVRVDARTCVRARVMVWVHVLARFRITNGGNMRSSIAGIVSERVALVVCETIDPIESVSLHVVVKFLRFQDICKSKHYLRECSREELSQPRPPYREYVRTSLVYHAHTT